MNEAFLEKLLDISRKLAENRLLDPLLEYAMAVALDLFHAERGYLVLLNQDDNGLEFRVQQDHDGQPLSKPEEQISHTIFDEVIKTRKSLVIANAYTDSDFQNADSVMALKLQSVMCVPLISRGNTIGAIYLENRSEASVFTEDDLKPLEYFAAQAAISIENAILNDELESRVAERTVELVRINKRLREEIEERKRIEKELQRLAMTDPLTGAYNRRHFFELAQQEFDRSQRYGRQISMIIFDIDFLKQINDSYGHLVGDQILQATAQRFMDNLRQLDIFARYGGDEFVVLLPETDLEQAKLAARRLHDVVSRTPVETLEGPVHLQISMGVACLHDTDDMEKLLMKADQALYTAKESGRNRVVVFDNGYKPLNENL
jgi:diguanylate cyclase (GGDEF)-like protein